MKLSDAIEKGRGMVKFEPNHWCTCLIGLGMAGAKWRHNPGTCEFLTIWPWLAERVAGVSRLHRIYPAPPEPSYLSEVSFLADDVYAGKITLDQAIDQIRIWESVMDLSPEPEVKPEYKETVNA